MDERFPQSLGRYEVLEELGRGAMGVVYLARDPLIGRQVALKVLRLPALAEAEERDQFRRRFIREAQSAGILAHPNIVTIHDVSEGEEGRPTFIAMEFIRGTNLKELLRPGTPLDLPFVSEVVGQIARALDYAHSQGVVHRDIKPANILITAEGQVKITDFGIARIDTSNLTQDTQLLGTPNYMAPEQIQGTGTDQRVDVFALGVMLYEMLTGQKPFQGESVTEVTHRIVYEDHQPASKQVTELPDGLDRILERALAKNPDARYWRAGELADELAELVRKVGKPDDLNVTQVVKPLSSEPETERSVTRTVTTTLDGMWRGLRSPRGLLLGVALLLVLVGGLGGAWLLQTREEPVEAPPAEPQADPRVQELIREGHRLLANGDPEQAAETFRDAERLAPDREEVRGWRHQAERLAEAYERLTERQRQLGQHLAAGEFALADGNFQEALAEVEEALELADDDEEAVSQAEEIRRRAEEGLARRARQRREAERRRAAEEARRREAAAQEAAAATATDTEPAKSEQSASEPKPVGPPTLEMEFISEQPQGTLTIWMDERRLLNQSFRFVEKRGFLGLGGGEAYKGRLYLKPTAVTPGTHILRVYVTPRGEAAQAEILEDVSFEPGAQRRLEIRFSAQGELSARIR